jgi:hypothetical protein
VLELGARWGCAACVIWMSLFSSLYFSLQGSTGTAILPAGSFWACGEIPFQRFITGIKWYLNPSRWVLRSSSCTFGSIMRFNEVITCKGYTLSFREPFRRIAGGTVGSRNKFNHDYPEIEHLQCSLINSLSEGILFNLIHVDSVERRLHRETRARWTHIFPFSGYAAWVIPCLASILRT